MKTSSPLVLFSVVLWLGCVLSVEAQSDSFIYQGRLTEGTNAASGSYDLQFVLFDSASGGNPVAGTNTLAPVAVNDGLFSLTLDFGSLAFDGSARWLQIAVRTNGSDAPYTTLAPRQPIIATPYAIHAANAALLNGQEPVAFAPATGSASYVAKPGDTMTGTLTLPTDGLVAGGSQFILTNGNVGIGTATPATKLEVNGTTRTKVLEITGADLAEKFPTSEKVAPGMVVAIDPQSPGKLCQARGAYNRRVAGVVSGANDFAAGAVLGNLPGHEAAPPIALSGRVYVWCDASKESIEPGDLLTTSDTPGHAMKVAEHEKAQGAVLGKAMTSLNSGTGMVLVLVTLQ